MYVGKFLFVQMINELSRLAHKTGGVVGLVTTSLIYSWLLDITITQRQHDAVLIAVLGGALGYAVTYSVVRLFFTLTGTEANCL